MGLFLGVKQPGLKADHSSPPNAEVKNGIDTSPVPHVLSWDNAELIKYRGNFALLKNILKYKIFIYPQP
jgi:hypothetical protein